MKNKFYLIWGMATFFILICSYFLGNSSTYFTPKIIIIGTIVIALITLSSYLLAIRNINHPNPNRFVNGIMVSTFLKFMLCVVAVAGLAFYLKQALHKPDLFYLAFVYLIYSSIETVVLAKLARTNS